MVESRIAKNAEDTVDLHRSSFEELQVARVYTRNRTEFATLARGYVSDDDQSDEDEMDGKMSTERQYHDIYNGKRQLKFIKTIQTLAAKGSLPGCQRLVEEKHYCPDGVCMLDVHFGLGQPYLSRKHYWPNQTLKTEKLFYVDNERTMDARKSGHWRTYHESGGLESEMQYDQNGVRTGFCKRYNEDGTLKWTKDYSKDYHDRITAVNQRAGGLEFSINEAARLLGFPEGRLPKTSHEVNREYRRQCALLHPDKSDDPLASERFIEANRARDLLLTLFSNEGSAQTSKGKVTGGYAEA